MSSLAWSFRLPEAWVASVLAGGACVTLNAEGEGVKMTGGEGSVGSFFLSAADVPEEVFERRGGTLARIGDVKGRLRPRRVLDQAQRAAVRGRVEAVAEVKYMQHRVALLAAEQLIEGTGATRASERERDGRSGVDIAAGRALYAGTGQAYAFTGPVAQPLARATFAAFTPQALATALHPTCAHNSHGADIVPASEWYFIEHSDARGTPFVGALQRQVVVYRALMGDLQRERRRCRQTGLVETFKALNNALSVPVLGNSLVLEARLLGPPSSGQPAGPDATVLGDSLCSNPIITGHSTLARQV